MLKLAIVLPCYNEEEILSQTIKRMKSLLTQMIKTKQVASASKILLVNDGSCDKTADIIRRTCAKDKHFCGLNLSRNFGHQSAILAGMNEIEADVYVTIDADLQDNPESIMEMLGKIYEGYDVVYGVRTLRNTDSWFKRTSATLYYKLLKILGVNIVYNHADFRMMTKRAVDALKQFPERNLFLRAIVPLAGFKSAKVYYDRSARSAGETKYPLVKMMALAWNGISNFSIIPLRFVTFMGFAICFISLFFLGFIIYRWSVSGTIVGWASLVTIITIFSGVQLLSLGIIGEYLAKVFVEVKKRPLYIVESKIGFGDN
ncbi:MAG: glycosyltransferase family 2 protein [Alphaproteobacteria bacterium]|nr:glycosyltransferase family 2 protein [Alphaproteobacteria bacterium]